MCVEVWSAGSCLSGLPVPRPHRLPCHGSLCLRDPSTPVADRWLTRRSLLKESVTWQNLSQASSNLHSRCRHPSVSCLPLLQQAGLLPSRSPLASLTLATHLLFESCSAYQDPQYLLEPVAMPSARTPSASSPSRGPASSSPSSSSPPHPPFQHLPSRFIGGSKSRSWWTCRRGTSGRASGSACTKIRNTMTRSLER